MASRWRRRRCESFTLPNLIHCDDDDVCPLCQDVPEYMKASLDQAVAVYTAMSTYLKNYANGVTSTVEAYKASA